VWEECHLYKLCGDWVHICLAEKKKVPSVLHHCHASNYGGHFGIEKTITKVLQVGFYWSMMFKDARGFIMTCARCQRTRNICERHEMPQSGILEVELFDVWGINFMGPFHRSYNNLYILVKMDHVCKRVEFLKKNMFTRFGTPRALLSDNGMHFCNKPLKLLLKRYGAFDKVDTPYHPKTNGQVELSNQELKRILEKTVDRSQKD